MKAGGGLLPSSSARASQALLSKSGSSSTMTPSHSIITPSQPQPMRFKRSKGLPNDGSSALLGGGRYIVLRPPSILYFPRSDFISPSSGKNASLATSIARALIATNRDRDKGFIRQLREFFFSRFAPGNQAILPGTCAKGKDRLLSPYLPFWQIHTMRLQRSCRNGDSSIFCPLLPLVNLL
eukprot:Gb_34580 [translate_table: standard]